MVSVDLLAKQAPIGILLMGLDGGIAKANPVFCRLTGYTEIQLRHLDNRAISHPEDFAAEVRIIQQMLDEGQHQWTFVKRYKCCDGSLRWAEVKLSLIENTEDGDTAILVFVTDLSDRKQAEQEIQQGREREALLEQSLKFEQLIRTLTEAVRKDLDKDQMLKAAVQGLVKTLNADGCVSSLFNSHNRTLEVCSEFFKDTIGPVQSLTGQAFPLTSWSEDCQQHLVNGKTFVASVPITQSTFLKNADPTLERFKSLYEPSCETNNIIVCKAMSPITDDQGLIGVLTVLKLQAWQFEPVEINLIEQVASQCAIALRQASLFISNMSIVSVPSTFARF